jgi:hypothetical protein
MSEDVEARRKFIDDNALDVNNLDSSMWGGHSCPPGGRSGAVSRSGRSARPTHSSQMLRIAEKPEDSTLISLGDLGVSAVYLFKLSLKPLPLIFQVADLATQGRDFFLQASDALAVG